MNRFLSPLSAQNKVGATTHTERTFVRPQTDENVIPSLLEKSFVLMYYNTVTYWRLHLNHAPIFFVFQFNFNFQFSFSPSCLSLSSLAFCWSPEIDRFLFRKRERLFMLAYTQWQARFVTIMLHIGKMTPRGKMDCVINIAD